LVNGQRQQSSEKRSQKAKAGQEDRSEEVMLLSIGNGLVAE
jgi:hypothetical protein